MLWKVLGLDVGKVFGVVKQALWDVLVGNGQINLKLWKIYIDLDETFAFQVRREVLGVVFVADENAVKLSVVFEVVVDFFGVLSKILSYFHIWLDVFLGGSKVVVIFQRKLNKLEALYKAIQLFLFEHPLLLL